ncbi:hypothetical protein [Endobacterium cereale]|uniref:hypothetical protein n=1 Tax=Endobacterium cereale TaxID=2663029 RepID=UPI002B4A60F5|nr:hypothetical protein [Endobacterium cereale]MEB2845930.1 hypothetical protein [Endobacterium cereale]
MVKYALMALMLSSASANAQAIVDKSGVELEKIAVEAMVKDVSAKFADPLAAQSKSLRKREGDAGSICGLVNAKNAYGGYAGFKPFRYIIDRRKIYFVNTGC